MSKTREHCRARDCHTAVPWCDAYVCISLDDSCTGSDGKLLDGPFAAKVVHPIAFNLKGAVNPLTPTCAACKEKCYTRVHCRQKKKHRQLPWSTVHIICSLSSAAIPERGNTMSPPSSNKRSKNIRGASVHIESSRTDLFNPKRKNTSSASAVIEEDILTGQLKPKTNEKESGENIKHTEESSVDYGEGGHLEEEGGSLEGLKAAEAAKLDIIPRSRTFLVTVSKKFHRVEVSLRQGI